MFLDSNGDRPKIPNIAIVVTDGKSTNRPNTLSEAQKMRNQGIQVKQPNLAWPTHICVEYCLSMHVFTIVKSFLLK